MYIRFRAILAQAALASSFAVALCPCSWKLEVVPGKTSWTVRMSSIVDSDAEFVHLLITDGLGDYLAKFEELGWTTMANFAFAFPIFIFNSYFFIAMEGKSDHGNSTAEGCANCAEQESKVAERDERMLSG